MNKMDEKLTINTADNNEVLRILAEIKNTHDVGVFGNPDKFYGIFIDLASNDNHLRETGKLLRTALGKYKAFAELCRARENRKFDVDKILAQKLHKNDFIDKDIALQVMKDLSFIAEYELFSPTSVNCDALSKSAKIDKKQAKSIIEEQREFVRDGFDSEQGQRNEIFISYADDDVNLALPFVRGIAPLEREHGIKHWHYKEMKPGRKIPNEIGKHLKRAKIVIALMSPNFVLSDFIMDIELEIIKEMIDNEEIKLFWFPLKEYTNWGEQTKVFRDTNALTQNIQKGTFEALKGAQRSHVLNDIRGRIIDEYNLEVGDIENGT